MVAFELSASASIGAIKLVFGKTASTAKVKIGPLWSKIQKLGKKMFLWVKKSFSSKICVHWNKVVGQKNPNIQYGPVITNINQLSRSNFGK